MKKKLIKRYILLCLPFICGVLLYGIGLYNIVSSLLFFVGGYVLIKNVFDYRVVNKNIRKYVDNSKKIDDGKCDREEFDRDRVDKDILKRNEDYCNDKYRYKYMRCDDIPGLKSTRIHKRIRRRY